MRALCPTTGTRRAKAATFSLPGLPTKHAVSLLNLSGKHLGHWVDFRNVQEHSADLAIGLDKSEATLRNPLDDCSNRHRSSFACSNKNPSRASAEAEGEPRDGMLVTVRAIRT
ncbi:MAG TPA: hypothetical protein VGC14_26745 [Rhizobium sp.]